MVRRLSLAATFLAAAMAFYSCSSPDAALGSMQSDVKSALNMYLVIKGVTPAKDATEINSNNPILVDFDRSLGTATIGAAAISVKASTEGATAVDCAYSYDDAQKRLTVSPTMLEGKTTYLVTVNKGLLSAAGEELREAYLWSFTTSASPSGSMRINSGATYSTEPVVILNVTANSFTGYYRFSETTFAANDTSLPFDALPAGNPKTATMTLSSGDGAKTLYYQYSARSSDLTTAVMSCGIILDTIHPNTPSVTGSALTNSPTPTWTWAAAGGGNGTFRYQIDSTSGTWTETTGTSYTATGLGDGSHTLYVEERDEAGNWSESPGSFATTVDTTPPGAPTITAPVLPTTTVTTPTWTWSASSGGNGTYRMQLDSTIGDWTTTTLLSFTPSAALSDGNHTFYVQARDAAGNWSSTSSKTVFVDTAGPTITFTTSTLNGSYFYGTNLTPSPQYTVTVSDGGGIQSCSQTNGSLTFGTTPSPSGGTTSYSWTSTVSAASDNTYAITFTASDVAGHSSSITRYFTRDTVVPGTPSYSTVPTNPTTDRTPTWSWASGGGGNLSYRVYFYHNGIYDYISTTATTYTYASALADSYYYFAVQEYDSAGNASAWTSTSTVQVNSIPNTPTVSLTTRYLNFVTDNTPTWTWSSNGFGNGTFRYKLYDSTTATTIVDWTTTMATSYTAATLTNVNGYYFYVQESDGADWSNTGYRYCFVTQVYPYDGLTGVSTATPFFWRGSTAINIVNTVQKYTAHTVGKITYYSWDAIPGSYSGTYFTPTSTLSASTSYTWRVQVENTLFGTTSWIPSETGLSFTTQ